ncbi:MAG: hypothetical protein JRN21_02495 [Nitrososphaerota archaeon]|nr:hypothetical protein [Nitrososphaerota archaeon]
MTTVTTTTTSDERTCQQGEVRDCVQPSSTTPSLPLCQGSATCEQADSKYLSYLYGTAVAGVLVTAFAEEGAIPFDAAIAAGDASALAYLELAGPNATPLGVETAWDEGYGTVMTGIFGLL